jgi:hypothetical protein
MALLKFLKERQQQVNQDKPAQPETAKQMYARQEAQRSAQSPMDKMPAEQRAKVDEIKARIERATQHTGQEVSTRQTSPGDTPVTQEAMRQNMTGQDKTAPAMSPTSELAGKTSLERGDAVRPSPTPPRPPQKMTPKPQQTIARRPPSWER